MQATGNGTHTPMVIRLENQDFLLNRERVAVASLKLDPHNQRLGYQVKQWLSQQEEITDSALHSALWEIDAVKNLYQSILQNGGLIEDPIIRPDRTVVEGNSRTVCLRELKKKYPSDSRWQEVYVRVLPEGVTEDQVMTLLGELHIAGKIEWKAYEQAEYVWKMSKKLGKTYDYLSSHLRMSRSKIFQKIAAYEETNQYIQESQDQQALSRFSFFEEFMKKKELRERRENDSAFMPEFRKWVAEGKFSGATDVRALPDILENTDALEAFRSGNMQSAQTVLNESDPSRNSDLYYAVEMATRQLQNTPLSEINDLRKGNSTKLAKLRALSTALQELRSMAGVEI